MSRSFDLSLAGRPWTVGPETQVMGIVNLTPDSFSDGGSFLEPGAAVDRALQMAEEGASIIDLGACSTRPGARPVGADEELKRLLPVVRALGERLSVPISIDTWHAEVFRACHDLGATILNDITALTGDPAMGPLVAELGVPCVLMHMRGDPLTMQDDPVYDDVVLDIKRFFSKVRGRVERLGVSWSQIILDPGIGFGKTVEQNLDILRRIDEFHTLERPLLVGTSRKSFLGHILNREDPRKREHATTATTIWLQAKGVQFLRVHDVQASVDAMGIMDQLNETTDS